jgi:hypothetical protein
MQTPHTHLYSIVSMLNAVFLPGILYIYPYALNSKLIGYSRKLIRGFSVLENSANIIYFAEVETNFLIFSTLDRHHIESVEGFVEHHDLNDVIR